MDGGKGIDKSRKDGGIQGVKQKVRARIRGKEIKGGREGEGDCERRREMQGWGRDMKSRRGREEQQERKGGREGEEEEKAERVRQAVRQSERGLRGRERGRKGLRGKEQERARGGIE